jgi:hypothetical protein
VSEQRYRVDASTGRERREEGCIEVVESVVKAASVETLQSLFQWR